MLRIVFMGAPEFAVPSLKRLSASEHDIAAVVSHPDKRRGRGGTLMPTPVKACALELGLPVVDAESLDDPSLRDQLSELKPDLFVVVAFRILPSSLLELPAMGSVNLHASLLPLYRGAAPIHWAVINGEKKTGCSVFFLKDEVDTGDVIATAETPVGPDETTGDLYERLKEMGADLLLEAVNHIEAGTARPKAQNDRLATPAPKLYKSEGEVNWNRPSTEIHNKIRGFSPFPAAWSRFGDEKLTIYRTKKGDLSGLKPGELRFAEGRLFVGCGDGSLELVELQLPGRKRMTGIEFANGFDLSAGLV